MSSVNKDIWGGFFKSYRVVEVIPIYRMSKEDWELLDWEDLRNTAKNRIVDMLTPDFLGFAKVNVFDKGRAKPNYLWPVTVAEAEEISAGGAFPAFGNTIEEELTTKAKEFGISVDALAFLISLYGMHAVLEYLRNREAPKPAQRGDLEQMYLEFTALAESGAEDFDDLEKALAIAMILVVHKGFEFLEGFIDAAEAALGEAEDKGLI